MVGKNQQKQKEILVVEDDANVLELFRIILDAHGYKVDCAVDGVDGLEKIMKKHYDLIILNIMMPRMNGYEVLEVLQKIKGFNVPIILETVKSETRVFALKPAIDYLYKPFDLDEMVMMVERKLNKANSKKFQIFSGWRIREAIKRALDKKNRAQKSQPIKPEPTKPISEIMPAVGKRRKAKYSGD